MPIKEVHNDYSLLDAQLAAQVAGPLAAGVRDTGVREKNIREARLQKPGIVTKDSIESAAQAISQAVPMVGGSSSLPKIDAPAPLDQVTFDKGKTDLAKLLSKEDSLETFADVDDLVYHLILQVIEGSNDYLAAKKAFFESERRWSDVKEQERLVETQRQVDATHTVNTWGKVEQSIASFGLIASGIAGICTGMIPLGIAAIAVGTLMALDQILDDKCKTIVASWIARGDAEEEKSWVNRIQFFCGWASFGLSIGLTGPAAIQMARAVADAVVKTGHGYYSWQLNVQKSFVMEVDAACRIAQKSVDTLFQEIQEICNSLYQLNENLQHIEENKRNIVRALLRFE